MSAPKRFLSVMDFFVKLICCIFVQCFMRSVDRKYLSATAPVYILFPQAGKFDFFEMSTASGSSKNHQNKVVKRKNKNKKGKRTPGELQDVFRLPNY